MDIGLVYCYNNSQFKLMAQWDKFLNSATPQGKLRSNTKNSKHGNTKSSRKLHSPYYMKNDNSISALFVQEMNKESQTELYLKDIRDAICQIKDIQKQNLECAKKTLHLLETKATHRDRSTVKKKRSRLALQEKVHTKIKEIDKMKLDLTEFMRRSHSTKKKSKQCQSLIRILR